MKIVLENIGRRFNREWVFRGITYSFERGNQYAILGPNGSGKSTLLQVISGSLTQSEGRASYFAGDSGLPPESFFGRLSMAAPYLELIEEFTLAEHIDFHFRFKNYLPGLTRDKIIELLGFEKSKNKEIRHFSSGMKQRARLALAFCCDTPVLLLDEPTSNLDADGASWYLSLIEKFSQNRLVIICSNQEKEYSFCRNYLNITDYK